MIYISNFDINNTFLYENNITTFDRIITSFREFSRDLLKPIWNRINKWKYSNSDSEDIIYLRIVLASALIRFEDESVINYGYNILYNLFINLYNNYNNILDSNGF